MKKTAAIFLIFCLFLVESITNKAHAQAPTITSFSPSNSKPGDEVTITGTNFNATTTNNVVFFGATRATVTTATSTSLTVTVPTGATYAPITVLNTVTVLACASLSNFNPIYSPAKSTITTSDFNLKQDFDAGFYPYSVVIGDLDGDGKPDLIVAKASSNTISVLRNTSTSGSISNNSFATSVEFIAGTNTRSVAIGDLDGDGKPDLVVGHFYNNLISVLRNTSISGSITNSSFATKVDFTTGSLPSSVAIGDIDGDGKPDLVAANFTSNSISILRNTSTSGIITTSSFATNIDFFAGYGPQSVVISDLDKDGKSDLAVVNPNSNTISVLRNTATSGSINNNSFEPYINFATGISPNSLAIGDVNIDGKPDLIVANVSNNTISVLRNITTSGSITSGSFATKVDFTTDANPFSVAVGDIDGDGKPDLAVVNYDPKTVSIFRNTGTSGIVSFASKVDFPIGNTPVSVAIGDLDGDGKPDLAVATLNSNIVSILHNSGVITTTGSLSDFTACSVTVSNEQSFTVEGKNLTNNLSITAPTGFEISTNSGIGFGSSLTLMQSNGDVATTTIYVRLATTATGTVSGNLACSSVGSIPRNIAVNGIVKTLPTANATNVTVCSGANASLTASGGVNYTWAGPNSFTSSQQNPTIANATISNAGIYTVSVSENGCSATATASVMVNPNPTVSATGATVCSGTILGLSANGGTGYIWAGPNSFSSTQQNPIVSNSAATAMSGVYSLTVNNVNSCTSMTTVNVIVNIIPPTPVPNNVAPIIAGSAITLTATGCSNTLRWYLSSNDSLVAMPVLPVTTTDFYARCEISSNGISCQSPNSVNVTVTVNPAVYIKSIITGNWEDPNTWDLNRIPQITDNVIIDIGHTLNISSATAQARFIEFRSNSVLHLANSLAKLTLGAL